MNWKCILKEAGKFFVAASLVIGYISGAAYITTKDNLLLQITGWSLIGLLVIALFIFAGMSMCVEKRNLFNNDDDV